MLTTITWHSIGTDANLFIEKHFLMPLAARLNFKCTSFCRALVPSLCELDEHDNRLSMGEKEWCARRNKPEFACRALDCGMGRRAMRAKMNLVLSVHTNVRPIFFLLQFLLVLLTLILCYRLKIV